MASPHGELEKLLQDSDAKPMVLPLEFLKHITRDFSEEKILGQGGYGVVYKGDLQSEKIIAVKKLFELRVKEKMFQDEVNHLMRMNKHQNVVQFVGYCAESKWEAVKEPSGSGNHVFAEIRKRLLCFEYVSNKSLDKHISEESLGLDWNVRYEIIKGICNGLHFLHAECHIVHLDLKPENILMDSSMMPKIADFGLSRIFGEQQSRIVTVNRAGTCGYMAPEYLGKGIVTKKADIFSLGVIVIEIITGHRDYPDFQNDSDDSTATHFQQFIEKVLASWRNKFLSTPNYKSMEKSTRQIRQCIDIALKCVDLHKEKRPTAKEIIEVLTGVGKMEAGDEGDQSDTQCKDRLLFLNTTHAIPPFIQTIPKESCEQRIVSLDVSQTKPWILTGHESGYIDIFDYEMQKSIESDIGDGNRATIIKFIERKKWFIVGSMNGYVTVYTYETKIQKLTSFRAKSKYLFPIDSLAIHPTQSYVLSSCMGYIQLWDWDRNWQCIRTSEKPWFHEDEYGLAFNPNDINEFASARLSIVTIWYLDSLKPNYTLCGHSEKVNCLDFFTHVDNKQYLITGSTDTTAKIWDLQKRACVHTIEGLMSPVIFTVSRPRLSVLITGTQDGAIHLWSTTDFRLKRVLNIGGPGVTYGLACLTESGRVVIGNESTLFMMESLDEEPADAMPKNPMSSYFSTVYSGHAFALITVVCAICMLLFVYH